LAVYVGSAALVSVLALEEPVGEPDLPQAVAVAARARTAAPAAAVLRNLMGTSFAGRET
jgi:hypothetical protein